MTSRPASLHSDLVDARPHRRALTIRAAVLVTAAAVFTLGLAGYLMSIASSPAHEFVAFVDAGSLEKDEILPRPDVLDKVNGLSHASEVAGRLNRSPWVVWRKYAVAAEGRVYVVRVFDSDPVRGAELVAVVRDTIVMDLRQRYDAALAPRRAYIAALEAEIADLTAQLSRPSAAAARPDASGLRAASDGWMALTNMRERLRDEQVFVALSKPPNTAGEVRRRDPDRGSRRILLTLTGASVGLVTGLGLLLFVILRTRAAHAFARA